MDGSDRLVVDDCCSASVPASGVDSKGRALQEPRGLTVDDELLNHPVVDWRKTMKCERYWLIIKPPLRGLSKEHSWSVGSPSM